MPSACRYYLLLLPKEAFEKTIEWIDIWNTIISARIQLTETSLLKSQEMGRESLKSGRESPHGLTRIPMACFQIRTTPLLSEKILLLRCSNTAIFLFFHCGSVPLILKLVCLQQEYTKL